MNINTSTEPVVLGEIDVSFEIDEDDLAYIIRPIVESEVENMDLSVMVADEVSSNGSGSIDIEDEAQQLLNQYSNGHPAEGNYDGTSCTTAKRFETAVYTANCRLSNSEQGSGAMGAAGIATVAEVRRLAEQVAAIQRALTALGAAVMPLG